MGKSVSGEWDRKSKSHQQGGTQVRDETCAEEEGIRGKVGSFGGRFFKGFSTGVTLSL